MRDPIWDQPLFSDWQTKQANDVIEWHAWCHAQAERGSKRSRLILRKLLEEEFEGDCAVGSVL
jgi:hypothetical protein